MHGEFVYIDFAIGPKLLASGLERFDLISKTLQILNVKTCNVWVCASVRVGVHKYDIAPNVCLCMWKGAGGREA